MNISTGDDMWGEDNRSSIDDDKARREQSARELPAAGHLAHQHGMLLIRHTQFHYSLRHRQKRWILHIYPGNDRLYNDKNVPQSPLPQYRETLDTARCGQGGSDCRGRENRTLKILVLKLC
jgi:hypothetical protein